VIKATEQVLDAKPTVPRSAQRFLAVAAERAQVLAAALERNLQSPCD
jgi:hypothetical protein